MLLMLALLGVLLWERLSSRQERSSPEMLVCRPSSSCGSR
jgi:hypothetical protein